MINGKTGKCGGEKSCKCLVKGERLEISHKKSEDVLCSAVWGL
jgi:hypothetical protein